MIWWFLVGILLGTISMALMQIFKSKDGILKVYIPDVDDEQPYLYVELNKPVGDICSKKNVTFKVDTQNLKTRK